MSTATTYDLVESTFKTPDERLYALVAILLERAVRAERDGNLLDAGVYRGTVAEISRLQASLSKTMEALTEIVELETNRYACASERTIVFERARTLVGDLRKARDASNQ